MNSKERVDMLIGLNLSAGILGLFTLVTSDYIGFRVFAGVVVVVSIVISSRLYSRYKELIAKTDMKRSARIFDYEEYIESYRRMMSSSSSKYNTFEDLKGIIFLSIQKDNERLPLFRALYKKTRGLNRYSKSRAYLLSYLLTNEIHKFIEEYNFIQELKKNHPVDQVNPEHFFINQDEDFWSIITFIERMYSVYTKDTPLRMKKYNNIHEHAIYIVLYYQYLINTEQHLLAEDYKEDYLKITQHKH